MKVTEHLAKANGRPVFSFEILPPLKGQTIHSIHNTIDGLLEFEPAFIDVTAHREEFVYKKKDNGLLEKVTTRKRPGTVGICAAIQYKYKIDTVPHLICGGFTKEETEYALIDLHFLGIENALVLRGDPIKSEGTFRPEPGGHAYALDLLKQVKDLNAGQYLHDEVENNAATDFCIGVAGYPEKHFEAPNMKSDTHFLKKKVESGADYIVTRMFFDNRAYFDFVDRCREAGINVPILPGIKPLTTRKQMSIIPHFFKVDLPEDLVDSVLACKTDDEVRSVGVEWGIAQVRELIKAGVPGVHFYTMGKTEAIADIARATF